MLLRCLKAELQKCRRSPVWLAFPVLPIFPAILGTGNYLGNLEALENGRYSLWSRHTLFSPMFFLPALLGVSCAWQWRLEHTDHNWNSFLTAPVPVRDLYGAKLILAAVVSLFGPGMHWRFVSPQREDRRHLRPGAAGAAGVAALRGSRRHVGLRGAALFQPGDPCLCPAGGFRPGGRHSGPEVHRPGGGYAFPYSLLCLEMRANNPQMELDLPPFLRSALVYAAVFALFSLRYLRRRDAAAE